jgi:hypothetical protein
MYDSPAWVPTCDGGALGLVSQLQRPVMTLRHAERSAAAGAPRAPRAPTAPTLHPCRPAAAQTFYMTYLHAWVGQVRL